MYVPYLGKCRIVDINYKRNITLDILKTATAKDFPAHEIRKEAIILALNQYRTEIVEYVFDKYFVRQDTGCKNIYRYT